jgi:Flp pilus assembly protein TadD
VEEAISYCRRSVQLDPRNAAYRARLVSLLRQHGDFDEADEQERQLRLLRR